MNKTRRDELLSTIRNGERCPGWGMAVEDEMATAFFAQELTRDEYDELGVALDEYATHPNYA